MYQLKKGQVGFMPTTGVVPMEPILTNDTKDNYMELHDVWSEWITESIERASATYFYKDGKWLSTGYTQLVIPIEQNLKYRSKKAKDNLVRKIQAFPNVVAIAQSSDGSLTVYFYIGHHENWIILRQNWRKYVDNFEEVLEISVKRVLEPEWADFEPSMPEDTLYGHAPLQELNDILPKPPYLKSEEADSLEEDFLWAEHEAAYAQEFIGALKYVDVLMKYGIDTTATAFELRNRCYECASLGNNYGRILLHSLAFLNPAYDRAIYDDIFTGVLYDHQGKRDIKTFVWCYENIYAAQVEAAAKLERDSFNANDIDDEQQ